MSSGAAQQKQGHQQSKLFLAGLNTQHQLGVPEDTLEFSVDFKVPSPVFLAPLPNSSHLHLSRATSVHTCVSACLCACVPVCLCAKTPSNGISLISWRAPCLLCYARKLSSQIVHSHPTWTADEATLYAPLHEVRHTCTCTRAHTHTHIHICMRFAFSFISGCRER